MNHKIVKVIGDSHASVFSGLEIQKIDASYSFDVTAVGGATASGLENPNAVTDSYRIFQLALRENSSDYVVAMLGEVDTGFVIWYRSQRNEISLVESLDKTLTTYQNFLLGIQNKKIMVISAPLPTIRDDQDWGEVANFRKEIVASQRERTDLTLMFNTSMHHFCVQNSIAYLDLDPYVLSEDGLLRAEFYSKNRLDHHYESSVFKDLLLEHFNLV